MNHRFARVAGSVFSLAVISFVLAAAQELFVVPEGVHTRWISFENPDGAKGQGGTANQGRKGAPARPVPAGQKLTLAEIEGPGVIRRIWITVRGEPTNLRGLVLRIFWDGQTQPSVEAPLQDFFGIPFARQVRFESCFFSNPEGRSFNCFIPMPFKAKARVEVENQSPADCGSLFFDVDYTIGDKLPEDLSYFHARYRRENPTTPKKDFVILPTVSGRGRYLGCNVGVRALEGFKFAWYGEGEIKIYLDGDNQLPTLVGTGTEDLVGSAWGLGRFDHFYQGCLLDQNTHGVWGFYRYHAADPVYFHKDIRVELQQMSGAGAEEILKNVKPEQYPELVEGHVRFDPKVHTSGWNNFEAPQDVCATAYWYQTLPSPDWGPIDSYELRMNELALPQK
ncbi:MAG TPA: glycoside hydrolase family 172 protein [Candidatus Glassbacteria bacterium]|nr:glycoside hydrolase family 172 protein [Candidatus Glassbacteria bacterium]